MLFSFFPQSTCPKSVPSCRVLLFLLWKYYAHFLYLSSHFLSLPVAPSYTTPSISDSCCSLQMDVVYTFQMGQTAVPGALRRQPSVVSQHNDAKTISSPTHVGISSSSLSANSAMAAPPTSASASSSAAGSECAASLQPVLHVINDFMANAH